MENNYRLQRKIRKFYYLYGKYLITKMLIFHFGKLNKCDHGNQASNC